jgi:hypothetical protein
MTVKDCVTNVSQDIGLTIYGILRDRSFAKHPIVEHLSRLGLPAPFLACLGY